MDKRSGKPSNSKGRRVADSANKKKTTTSRNSSSTNTTRAVGNTKRPSSLAKIEETRMYKLDEAELKKAETAKKESGIPRNKFDKKQKKKSRKKKKSLAWRIIQKIIIALVILGILAGLIVGGILAGIFLGFFGDDFKMTKEDLTIEFSNSEVYDSEGNLICTLSGNEKRKIVSLDDMPKYLPKAYVAIEDERFYEHSGVDIKRTGAATVTYLLNRGNSSFGGSSITQQLVKNITDDKEDSALRKVKEMARAIQIEKEISKDNILELYLNIIFVGGNNINGVALGAEYYFNKNVSDLTIAESAFLAGINHTPNSYNPFVGTEAQIQSHKELAVKRTKTVLNKMKQLGYINQDEFNTAVEEVNTGLSYQQGAMVSGVVYSDHTEAAIDEIIEQLMEEKEMSRDMAETKVYGGGYKIYTTQVAKVQNTMEAVMTDDKFIMAGREHKEDGTLLNEQSQAAMVVIEPSTGKVVGCVGRLGKKNSIGDLNRAVQTQRQVGSAMKPLAVVGPAIQEGIISPASVYEDKQTTEFTGSAWPKNYYNGFKGKQTVRECIEISGNVIPVRILKELGVSTSIQYLNQMGLTGVSESTGLSLALGSKEFSVLQMAAAYATIANDGEYIEPTFYTKVVDSEGNTILEPQQDRNRVFGKSEDYLLKSIVTQPVVGANGTATYCKVPGIDTACKTGTTDSDNDRWLCGFTPYYAAACWYGYDIGEQIIFTKATPSNPSGGIWDAVMTPIHEGLPSKVFERPDDVVSLAVCRDSGLLPSEGCTNLVTDWFIASKVPKDHCGTPNSDIEYAICEDSGLIAIEGACKRVIYTKFNTVEEVPKGVCNIHKVAEPDPTPSDTPSPTPSEEPSPTPTNTTSPSPSNTTSPSPSDTTSPTPTPSVDPKPTDTPTGPDKP